MKTTISAAERTPVEIWQQILRHAIASPLLPFTEDGKLSTDLIDNLQTLSADCRHYRMYRDVTQATIERLRLVCRAWADFLRNDTKDCALTDLDSNNYTSKEMNEHARRVQLWNSALCVCSTNCEFAQEKWIIDWTDEMNKEQFLRSRIPNVEILILDPLIIASLKFLEPLSNLVALSLHADTYVKVTWRMNELSTYATNLTHLNLDYVIETSRFLSEEITHPSIRFLSLRMEYQYGIFEHRKILNWKFPSLKTFRIHGVLHPEHGDSIKEFLSHHVNHLTGLDMEYRLFDGDTYIPGHIPSDLWNICPVLTSFGINFLHISKKFGLYGKERSSRTVPPLEFLLHGGFSDLFITPPELANLLHDLIARWKITKIISAEPWDTMEVLKSDLEEFLEEFERKDIPVVDHFNIKLQDAIEGWSL
ncbi:hypothetical protein CPB86DRAFT_787533 [Serendipita vermifera]|nr:hypothetical protein CPB86DRAFT_787533 [Serendipita vermifera]